MKQSAGTGDMRAWIETSARLDVMAEAMKVSRGLLITIPRSAIPLRAKLTAVSRGIGGRFGATAHPTNITEPSRTTSAADIAATILGNDIFGNFTRIAVTCTLLLSTDP
jgi:hypothetical protein